MTSSFQRVILGYIIGVMTNEGAKAMGPASMVGANRYALYLTRM